MGVRLMHGIVDDDTQQFPKVKPDPLDSSVKQQLMYHIEEMLTLLGYDVSNQHFQRTPERVAQVLLTFHANGDTEEVSQILELSFDDPHDSLVMVGPIKV